MPLRPLERARMQSTGINKAESTNGTNTTPRKTDSARGNKRMKIRDIITLEPLCISPDATLVEAAEDMKSLDVGILPICENDRLIGTLTDRDIIVHAVAEGRNPYTLKVRDVMSDKSIYCLDDQNVEDAAGMMEKNQICWLPVLDRDKRLVGIVSLGDLAARSSK
jgi:CBS domain-containing protein